MLGPRRDPAAALQNVHYEGDERRRVDVLRVAIRPMSAHCYSDNGPGVDDPGVRAAYPIAWPVETLLYIGEETTATESPERGPKRLSNA